MANLTSASVFPFTNFVKGAETPKITWPYTEINDLTLLNLPGLATGNLHSGTK